MASEEILALAEELRANPRRKSTAEKAAEALIQLALQCDHITARLNDAATALSRAGNQMRLLEEGLGIIAGLSDPLLKAAPDLASQTLSASERIDG